MIFEEFLENYVNNNFKPNSIHRKQVSTIYFQTFYLKFKLAPTASLPSSASDRFLRYSMKSNICSLRIIPHSHSSMEKYLYNWAKILSLEHMSAQENSDPDIWRYSLEALRFSFRFRRVLLRLKPLPLGLLLVKPIVKPFEKAHRQFQAAVDAACLPLFCPGACDYGNAHAIEIDRLINAFGGN